MSMLTKSRILTYIKVNSSQFRSDSSDQKPVKRGRPLKEKKKAVVYIDTAVKKGNALIPKYLNPSCFTLNLLYVVILIGRRSQK